MSAVEKIVSRTGDKAVRIYSYTFRNKTVDNGATWFRITNISRTQYIQNIINK